MAGSGWLSSLIVCSCIAVEPIDPDQLEKMRLSMEAALSRIDSFQLQYTLTWEKDANSPYLQNIRDLLKAKRQKQLETANPETRRALEQIEERAKANTTVECMLLYDFPSLRLDTRTIRVFPDGSSEEDRRQRIAYKGTHKEMNYNNKTVNIKNTSIDTSTLSALPTVALGLCMKRTLDRPLSESLKYPAATTLEGREMISGRETVVIKIGPQFTADDRPAGLSEGSWMRLWLAPSLSYLAIRTEYHTVHKGIPLGKVADRPDNAEHDFFIDCFELSDFQPARDEARDEILPFPRVLIHTKPGGTTRWDISDVRVNLPISPKDWESATPEGFLESRDGIVPTIRLSGGQLEQMRRVEETMRAANGLLAQTPPPASEGGWLSSLRILVPIVLLILTVSFILLAWRQRHAL